MGVTDLVHYSFPRHMSQELLARRRDAMKQAAAANGIKFHFVTAPDPMGEGGLNATQQFVMEDLPRERSCTEPQTAFFSTNCGMMDPMIKSVLTNGGYIPEQCCPSPTHGYPTALGVSIPPDKAGDMEFISEQNRRVIAESKMTGHFGTWPVAEAMLSIRAMTDLLVDAEPGKADYKDPATVKKYMESLAAGHAVTLEQVRREEGQPLPLPCQRHLLLGPGRRAPRPVATVRRSLELRGITKEYGGHRVLKGDLPRRSGSGRSTRWSARTARASPP